MESEKLVCDIGSAREQRSDKEKTSADWFFVNQRAHEMLTTVKTSIGNDHRWDKHKKYFNKYELISSSTPDAPSCSSYQPTSRSFYKMIEMLHDHHGDLTTQHPCKAAFLCDAPGGFVEAFLVYRRRQTGCMGGWIGKDVLHAISLVAYGTDVPSWRIPRDMLRNNNVHLHGGDTGNNGDLYSIRNIDDFVEKVGQHSCELVTADGGFDVSSDFNNQEGCSLRLLVSQVYTALRTMSNGGAFLMKIYDISLPATMRLLWHLHCCFSGGIVIDKPFTSRAANSEKFLICKWFDRTTRVNKLMESLRVSVCRSQGEVPLVRGGRQLPPSWFLRELSVYNLRYIAKQTRAIVETVQHMRSTDFAYPKVIEQRAAARQWCQHYGMAMSTPPHPRPTVPSTHSDSSSFCAMPDQAPASQPDTLKRPGTCETQRPARCKSRSPSETPYKDGLLLPGRKLFGENCADIPGGGPAEIALNEVA